MRGRRVVLSITMRRREKIHSMNYLTIQKLLPSLGAAVWRVKEEASQEGLFRSHTMEIAPKIQNFSLASIHTAHLIESYWGMYVQVCPLILIFKRWEYIELPYQIRLRIKIQTIFVFGRAKASWVNVTPCGNAAGEVFKDVHNHQSVI